MLTKKKKETPPHLGAMAARFRQRPRSFAMPPWGVGEGGALAAAAPWCGGGAAFRAPHTNKGAASRRGCGPAPAGPQPVQYSRARVPASWPAGQPCQPAGQPAASRAWQCGTEHPPRCPRGAGQSSARIVSGRPVARTPGRQDARRPCPWLLWRRGRAGRTQCRRAAVARCGARGAEGCLTARPRAGGWGLGLAGSDKPGPACGTTARRRARRAASVQHMDTQPSALCGAAHMLASACLEAVARRQRCASLRRAARRRAATSRGHRPAAPHTPRRAATSRRKAEHGGPPLGPNAVRPRRRPTPPNPSINGQTGLAKVYTICARFTGTQRVSAARHTLTGHAHRRPRPFPRTWHGTGRSAVLWDGPDTPGGGRRGTGPGRHAGHAGWIFRSGVWIFREDGRQKQEAARQASTPSCAPPSLLSAPRTRTRRHRLRARAQERPCQDGTPSSFCRGHCALSPSAHSAPPPPEQLRRTTRAAPRRAGSLGPPAAAPFPHTRALPPSMNCPARCRPRLCPPLRICIPPMKT